MSVLKLLIDLATADDAPTFERPPEVLQLSARQVAMRLPTSLSVVLLRNFDIVNTTHDFRAWCWQCIWAMGNRAGLTPA